MLNLSFFTIKFQETENLREDIKRRIASYQQRQIEEARQLSRKLRMDAKNSSQLKQSLRTTAPMTDTEKEKMKLVCLYCYAFYSNHDC